METKLTKTKATRKGIYSALALLLVLSSLGLASRAMGQSPCQLYSIGDTVWHDLNKNAQQDPDEPGIVGVLLELFDGNNQLIRDINDIPITTMTDAYGHYQFQVYGRCQEPNPLYGQPGQPEYITYDGVYGVHVAASNFDPLSPHHLLACTTGSVLIINTVIDQDIYDYDFGAVEYSLLLDCTNPRLGAAGHCTVFELSRGKVGMSSGDVTGVTGDVCIGGNGKLAMSGGQYISGKAYLAPGATGPSNTTRIKGGVVTNANLSAEMSAALYAASSAAGLGCDLTLPSLNGVSTIAPVNDGGQNVICVGNFQVTKNQKITLTGSHRHVVYFQCDGVLQSEWR